MTVAERFRYAVNSQTGCWEWLGSLNNSGYGTITIGSRTDGSRGKGERMTVDDVAFKRPAWFERLQAKAVLLGDLLMHFDEEGREIDYDDHGHAFYAVGTVRFTVKSQPDGTFQVVWEDGQDDD